MSAAIVANHCIGDGGSSGVARGLMVVVVVAMLIVAGIWIAEVSGLAGVEVTEMSHAIERHGEIITEATRRCLDDKKPELLMTRSFDGHWAEVCEFRDPVIDENGDEHRYAVRITRNTSEAFEEITVIGDPRWESIWDVELYLGRAGYGYVP